MMRVFAAALLIPMVVPMGMVHADDSCSDVIIRSVPGTWETDESMSPTEDAGMMGGFNKQARDNADGVTVDAQIIPYPAQFGGVAGIATQDKIPYPESRDIGVDNTVRQLVEDATNCPDSKIVLAGFSQGADVAGDAMEVIAQGKVDGITQDDVDQVFLYADPKRSANEELVSKVDVGGQGIMGTARDFNGYDDVFTFCLKGDAVCAVPEDSTEVTGVLSAMGGDDETKDSPLADAVASLGVMNLDKGVGGDHGALQSFFSTMSDPNAIKTALESLSQVKLTPEQIDALVSLAGSHGGPEGHTAYATQKTAPDGTAPIEWGAKQAVAL